MIRIAWDTNGQRHWVDLDESELNPATADAIAKFKAGDVHALDEFINETQSDETFRFGTSRPDGIQVYE